MKTIQEVWLSFLKQVVPASAGMVQRAETKVAFYAGATAMFGLMKNLSDNQDEGVKQLKSFQAELHEFAATNDVSKWT